MEITRKSLFSGITRTKDLDVTYEQLIAWKKGQHIQHAMPQLSGDEREFLLTGASQEEWDQYTNEDDE